jgi:hypothetical protein
MGTDDRNPVAVSNTGGRRIGGERMHSLRATIRASWPRLTGAMRRGSDTQEFDAELEAHLAMDTEAGIKAGLDAAEARRQALRTE